MAHWLATITIWLSTILIYIWKLASTISAHTALRSSTRQTTDIVDHGCKAALATLKEAGRRRSVCLDDPNQQLLLQQRPSTQQMALTTRSALLDTPVEVLLMIRDFLSPVDAAALAMTNHGVYYILETTWQSLEKEARMMFLRFYEATAPDRYLCHVCAKFHRFHDTSGRWLPIRDCETKSLRLDLREDYTYFSRRYCLCFCIVQLIMNRHFFGPEFGFEPSALYMEWPWYRETVSGISHAYVREARIANDELILRTINRFYRNAPGRRSDLKKELRRRHFTICPHVDDGLDRRAGVKSVWRNDRRMLGAGTCDRCSLGYEVTQHDLSSCGWGFTCTVWQNVGAGRSPQDPKWRSCCDDSRVQYACAKVATDHSREAFNGMPSTALVYTRDMLVWPCESPCD